MKWAQLTVKEKVTFMEDVESLGILVGSTGYGENREPLFFDDNANMIPFEDVYNEVYKREIREEKLKRILNKV